MEAAAGSGAQLERLTGKIVSTRKAEDDDYYFETERRLRAGEA